MSNIFKALKNLTKQSPNLQGAIKTDIDSIVGKNSSPPNMAMQVILNNGSKMPRIGCEYIYL